MNYIKLYVNFLKKYLKPKRRLKVIFDCSNGVTSLVLREFFKTHYFITSKLINSKIDGNFPAHGPNPMLEGAMDDLAATVKKHKADLGVIFDGDGDRAFFVDNKGRPIVADIVIALIGKNYKGPLVIDPRVGYLAREIAAAAGKKVYDSRVGHFFMKRAMAEHKLSFGGELSGHYYFYFSLKKNNPSEVLAKEGSRGYYADSGIFAAIQFINVVSKLKIDLPPHHNGKTVWCGGLASWIDKLPRYYRSGEVNFKVKDKDGMMRKIEKLYKNRVKKISHLDGVKMEFNDFWISVRPSNTEDLLRLNVEAKKKAVFDREFARIKKMMK